MKKILLSLLALIAISANAQMTKVFEVDYENSKDWASWTQLTCNNVAEGLEVVNTEKTESWKGQTLIAYGISTKVGSDYIVRITAKSSAAAEVPSALGDWDGTVGGTNKIKFTTEYSTCDVAYSGCKATNSFVNLQSGEFVGTITIKKIQVFEVSKKDSKGSMVEVINDNLNSSKDCCMSCKSNDSENESGVAGGEYVVYTKKATSNAWDAQVSIDLPYAALVGTEITVSFDYKASEAVTVETQSHGIRGDYHMYYAIGNVAFTTEYQTLTKTITVDSSMAGSNGMRSIVFNIAMSNDIIYYFDNIKVSMTSQKVQMSAKAANTYSTFCAPFSVEVPAGAKAYTAQVEGSKVVLTDIGETIKAGTPVIIEATEDITKELEGLAEIGVATCENSSLVGTFDSSFVPKGAYVLQNQDGVVAFYKVTTEDISTHHNGCYLVAPASSAKVLTFEGEDATAITEVKAINNSNRKMIENGKVVIVKNGVKYNVSGQQVK